VPPAGSHCRDPGRGGGAAGGRKTEAPGYALLGAIIDGPGGTVFIRFVAPSRLADSAESAFRAMVESPFGRCAGSVARPALNRHI
jgi:hypothetical protein